MKLFRFIFSAIITTALIIVLSISIKGKPAFGALLNPFTGFWNNAEKAEVQLPSTVALNDLDDEATIYFDERSIPHIFAKNEHDLYFLQGYVVANLRLWQMEFQVLAAEGRISEIIGEKAIDFDREQRNKGLTFGAENKLKVIENDPLAQDLIGAYTDGVNAYINEISKRDLPLEYKLLGYTPEPWTPYKTALLLMNMSNVLTNTEYDVENTNFVSKYGTSVFDTLFNQTTKIIDPIFPTPEEGWEAKFGINQSNSATDTSSLFIDGNNDDLTLSKTSKKSDVQIGSNNWALSGSRTKSGYPLLANDPHLGLTFPSVWIEMHLSGPQSNTYGVTFPGSPGIVIGFNDHIGWGVTNAGRDVKDWYTVEFKDASRNEYKYKGNWVPTEKVIEEYKVKGAPSVFDTLIYTHLGPVTHENFKTQQGEKDLALQWMAHKGGQEYLTFYLLNRARNFDEYLTALSYYSCPAQNFIFSSVDGDIALSQQGKFPILEKDQSSFLQDAATSDTWSEFIPQEHIPVLKNPKKGFVFSANQHVADTTYPYNFSGTFEYFRNRVIPTELRKMRQAEASDMKNLQYNNFNLIAAESLPYLLPYVQDFNLTFEAQDALEALRNWDYWNNKEYVAPTYFQLFFDHYYTLLWDELVTDSVQNSWSNYTLKDGMPAPKEFQTIQLLKDSTQHSFIDKLGTEKIETTSDLVNMAFQKMVDDIVALDVAEWGKYKGSQINHLLGISAFSTVANVGGGYKMVNASGRYHGPSWRMILDFADGKVSGTGVYPGGQSGNPGSPYYDNMVQEWVNGDYHQLVNSSNTEDFEAGTFTKITFKPQ